MTAGPKVAESLRQGMFDEVIRPGDPLVEVEIARALGVSRGPVREAFAMLEQEGLVRRAANRRVFMTQLGECDIEEITSLRLCLETLAVQLASHGATDEDLSALEENTRAQEAADDDPEAARIDIQFHEILVRSAGHERLLGAWMNVRAQIRLLMRGHRFRDRIDKHRRLVRLLKQRDECGAVEALQSQLSETRTTMLRRVRASADAQP